MNQTTSLKIEKKYNWMQKIVKKNKKGEEENKEFSEHRLDGIFSFLYEIFKLIAWVADFDKA